MVNEPILPANDVARQHRIITEVLGDSVNGIHRRSETDARICRSVMATAILEALTRNDDLAGPNERCPVCGGAVTAGECDSCGRCNDDD